MRPGAQIALPAVPPSAIACIGSALIAAENLLLAAVMAVMALLPLAEILLRATMQVGVSGAASFTQHLA